MYLFCQRFWFTLVHDESLKGKSQVKLFYGMEKWKLYGLIAIVPGGGRIFFIFLICTIIPTTIPIDLHAFTDVTNILIK